MGAPNSANVDKVTPQAWGRIKYLITSLLFWKDEVHPRTPFVSFGLFSHQQEFSPRWFVVMIFRMLHPKKDPMEAASSRRTASLIPAYLGFGGHLRAAAFLPHTSLRASLTLLFYILKNKKGVIFFSPALSLTKKSTATEPSTTRGGWLRTWRVFVLHKHPCEDMVQPFPTGVSCWGLYRAGGSQGGSSPPLRPPQCCSPYTPSLILGKQPRDPGLGSS